LHRWIFDKAEVLGTIQYLPEDSYDEVNKVIEMVRKCTYYHGVGKMTPMAVLEETILDLEALSDLLGTLRT